MRWPNKIYVATKSGGVYYTENFEGPPLQPSWIAVNTGLPSLDCKEFAIDPFEPEKKQYVLLESSRVLYRRDNRGYWKSILHPRELPAVNGSIGGFCADPQVEGRLWVNCSHNPGGYGNTYFVMMSEDWGDTWQEKGTYKDGDPWNYGLGTVRSYGNNVYVSYSAHLGAIGHIAISTNAGTSFVEHGLSFNWVTPILLNKLLPNQIYFQSDVLDVPDLAVMFTSGSHVDLLIAHDPERSDTMWFDPVSSGTQRLINDSQVFYTTNDWSTSGSSGVISPEPISISPYGGDDADQIIVGLHPDPPSLYACVGVLYGNDDTSVTPIAGSSCATSPYDGSIPYTAGEPCIGGIQALPVGSGGLRTHAVAMPGYIGDGRGTPMAGDRGAWDVVDYPEHHAKDLKDGAPIHHVPEPDGSFSFIYSPEGDYWQTIQIPSFAGQKHETIFTFAGELYTVDGPFRIYNLFGVAQGISRVFLSVAGTPLGDDLIVDVHQDGTTIFTNQDNRPRVVDGENIGEASFINISSWSAESYLTAHIDQVGSTFPGSHLVVHIVHGDSSYYASSSVHVCLIGEPYSSVPAYLKTYEGTYLFAFTSGSTSGS